MPLFKRRSNSSGPKLGSKHDDRGKEANQKRSKPVDSAADAEFIQRPFLHHQKSTPLSSQYRKEQSVDDPRFAASSPPVPLLSTSPGGNKRTMPPLTILPPQFDYPQSASTPLPQKDFVRPFDQERLFAKNNSVRSSKSSFSLKSALKQPSKFAEDKSRDPSANDRYQLRPGVISIPEFRCLICKELCRGDTLKVADNLFHMRCFKCAHCGCALANSGFFAKGDLFYCNRDYHALFGTRCKACKQVIEGEVIAVLGFTYHSTCFKCFRCRKNFTPGQEVIVDGDEVYCEHCPSSSSLTKNGTLGQAAQESQSPERCCKCNLPIGRDQSSLKALDLMWHLDCFRCQSCGLVLRTEYFAKNQQPYCESDYQRLYGVTCSSCAKYISGKVIEAGEKRFHPSCARCFVCYDFFAEGEEMLIHGDQVWHPRCDTMRQSLDEYGQIFSPPPILNGDNGLTTIVLDYALSGDEAEDAPEDLPAPRAIVSKENLKSKRPIPKTFQIKNSQAYAGSYLDPRTEDCVPDSLFIRFPALRPSRSRSSRAHEVQSKPDASWNSEPLRRSLRSKSCGSDHAGRILAPTLDRYKASMGTLPGSVHRLDRNDETDKGSIVNKLETGTVSPMELLAHDEEAVRSDLRNQQDMSKSLSNLPERRKRVGGDDLLLTTVDSMALTPEVIPTDPVNASRSANALNQPPTETRFSSGLSLSPSLILGCVSDTEAVPRFLAGLMKPGGVNMSNRLRDAYFSDTDATLPVPRRMPKSPSLGVGSDHRSDLSSIMEQRDPIKDGFLTHIQRAKRPPRHHHHHHRGHSVGRQWLPENTDDDSEQQRGYESSAIMTDGGGPYSRDHTSHFSTGPQQLEGYESSVSLPAASDIRSPQIIAYSELATFRKKLPKRVNRRHLETHLSDVEFGSVFGMNREAFYAMPLWKQATLKKLNYLF